MTDLSKAGSTLSHLDFPAFGKSAWKDGNTGPSIWTLHNFLCVAQLVDSWVSRMKKPMLERQQLEECSTHWSPVLPIEHKTYATNLSYRICAMAGSQGELAASGFLPQVREEQSEEQKAVSSCPPSRPLCTSRGTAAFLSRVQFSSALP